MSKIGLLDLDSWVYRCGYAAEKTYYLVDGLTGEAPEIDRYDNYKDAKARAAEHDTAVIWSRREIEPVDHCLQTVKTSLENTIDVLGLTDYTGYLSGRGNFRDDVFPDYKANRETLGKPKHYRAIRDYLIREWRAVLVDGMEADDAIRIAAKAASYDFVVVGVDKDLDQIVGDHYNWVTGESYTVSAKDSIRFFYEQLLSGDPTDNIPGIDGIGPVKAKKALAECKTPKECAETVFAMYRDAGFKDDVLERNATLVWIKRAKDDSHPLWRHLGQ
jgi:hypothetical protein